VCLRATVQAALREQRANDAAIRSEERANTREVVAKLQQKIDAAEAERLEAVRETIAELREYQQRAAVEREEATRASAGLWQQLFDLETSLERVRCTSKHGLLEQVAGLRSKVKELGARRTLNQRRLQCADLADHRARAATEALQKRCARTNERWASGGDAEVEAAQLRAALATAQVETEAARAELGRVTAAAEQQLNEARAAAEEQLKEAKAEAARLRAIAEPDARYFFKDRHFSAPVDLAIIQALQLGVSRRKVTNLFLVFARLFRITLPSRERKVPGPWVDGKRTSVRKRLLFIPGLTHVKHTAGVMYELNKLQVGEWLVDHLESDETSCCYVADGAEAQQLERLGQILTRRINGELQIRALDLTALVSKTGEAQAAACRQSFEDVALMMERASQASRAARARVDMERIRRLATGDALTEQLLAAAFDAMAKATANHTSEWLPAGELKTDGSLTATGKLCAAQITPELRARYDALVSTSTCVERLHAIGRFVDDASKHQRIDSRAGVQLCMFNDGGGWLAEKELSEQELRLDAARKAASEARRTTLKALLIAAGRAKREAREAQLGGKRARREKKKAERARLEAVELKLRYSLLKPLQNPELQDQLKVWKLKGKTGFATTQKDRVAYITMLQKLIFDAEGDAANDLDDGDSGCGTERVVRKRRVAAEEVGGKRKGKPREVRTMVAGGKEYEWAADEKFTIERILDKKMVAWRVGKVMLPQPPARLYMYPIEADHHLFCLCAVQNHQGLRRLPGALGGLAAGDGHVGVPRAARGQRRHPARSCGRV
jgi:hypothetical protein